MGALATHYGIGDIRGEQFRKVALRQEHRRGGLLGHGSILTLSANGIETSPVVRGIWVLENILGTPPPPPPQVQEILNIVEDDVVIEDELEIDSEADEDTEIEVHKKGWLEFKDADVYTKLESIVAQRVDIKMSFSNASPSIP